MADRTRLVTIGVGGQVTTVRDYELAGTYEKVRGSFKWTAPPARATESTQDRRFSGSRTVAENHDNGQISWTAMVSGGADTCLANAGQIMADLRYAGSIPRFVEFRAEGSTYSTLFEVRGSATVQLNYGWAQFVGAGSMPVDVSIPVGPLPRGLPMDVYDDFLVDTEGDYTFDSGTAADVATTGGAMTPVVGAALSTERGARHTVRGYTHLDAQLTAHGAPGATTTSFKLGRRLRASTSSTYVDVYVDDNGTNSRLRVDVLIAGVRTNRASTNLVTRVASGVELWVRGRIEGNVVYSEYFTSTPTPMGTPTLTGTAYTLTSAEQTSLVAGSAGWSWIPIHASAVVYDLRDEPFTYRNRNMPDDVRLNGTIPGDAPALADITLTASGSTGAPTFALLGWTERPGVPNYIWNGDFEDTGTDGWGVAIATGVQAIAGTSITRDTTAARTKYGTANGVVVTPASSGAGANFKIYRRFRKGVTYTANVWMSAATSTTSMVLKLGTNGDVATSSAAALTTTPTLYTVAWVPTADVEAAGATATGIFLSVQTNAATATTFNIDAVSVYEGTTAPSSGRQNEGAGGVPPFGIITATSSDAGDLTGWAVAFNAVFRAGAGLLDAVVAGAETYTASWWIDPHLMLPDDFTFGEIDIEVWGRFYRDGTVLAARATLTARPESGTGFGAERPTAEWGMAGRLLPAPSTGTCLRRSRLGTLTLPIDTTQPARWKLWLACSTAVGSTGGFGLDFLTCVPARYRCSSPSGKANDTTYPKFITTTAETAKTVLSDLRGVIAKPPLPGVGDRGLGGTPIELPPGSIDMLVDMSSLVPDDPTSDSTSETNAMPATVHVAVWPRWNALRSS